MLMPTNEPSDAANDEKLTAEQRLWRALRGRRLNDRKFRRKYDVADSGITVDFVCLEAGIAIDVLGDDAPKLTAEKGRVLKAARLRLLRIPEADVLRNFEKTLQLIWRETEQTVKRRPSF
jgi:very-short-patch-repair endonuclease